MPNVSSLSQNQTNTRSTSQRQNQTMRKSTRATDARRDAALARILDGMSGAFGDYVRSQVQSRLGPRMEALNTRLSGIPGQVQARMPLGAGGPGAFTPPQMPPIPPVQVPPMPQVPTPQVPPFPAGFPGIDAQTIMALLNAVPQGQRRGF
jgi:hypothetical protein